MIYRTEGNRRGVRQVHGGPGVGGTGTPPRPPPGRLRVTLPRPSPERGREQPKAEAASLKRVIYTRTPVPSLLRSPRPRLTGGSGNPDPSEGRLEGHSPVNSPQQQVCHFQKNWKKEARTGTGSEAQAHCLGKICKPRRSPPGSDEGLGGPGTAGGLWQKTGLL